MFKTGDIVKYVGKGVHNFPQLMNKIGQVYSSDPFFAFTNVDFGSLGIMACHDEDLELIVLDNLPTGMMNENWVDSRNNCDCGGYKTFGSMQPALHSPWCSSLERSK